MAATILVIDDEAAIREALLGILSDEGFQTVSAESAEHGLALLEQGGIDLVLLDIWMPGMDGMAALREIKEKIEIPVIMISGHGTVETAVEATKMGAYDFIEKPLSYDKVILSINKGLQFFRLQQDNRLWQASSAVKSCLSGHSEVICQLRDQVELVSPSDAWVLIRGEHGTGKELVAQSIHQHSQRVARPLIAVNCAAIPEDLIESELFGHEKGAFTGANSRQVGKFDQADGSTLFLDEIGDMSLKSQAKVLRILQEQTFERVGGRQTIRVNVRVLAATNKDLEAEISQGNFRADLFYRLNVVPIIVPPLRDRLEDIGDLIQDFQQQFKQRGQGEKHFSAAALALLKQHQWPGNVRELKNVIERLMIMSRSSKVTDREVRCALAPGKTKGGEKNPYFGLPYKAARHHFELSYFKEKLLENNGNMARTAEQIGMERSHLYKKIKQLGLKSEE